VLKEGIKKRTTMFPATISPSGENGAGTERCRL